MPSTVSTTTTTVSYPNDALKEAALGGVKPGAGSGSLPAVGTGKGPVAEEGYLGNLLAAMTGRQVHHGNTGVVSQEELELETKRLLFDVAKVAAVRPEVVGELNEVLNQTAANLRTSIDVALSRVRDILKTAPTQTPTPPSTPANTSNTNTNQTPVPKIPQPSLINVSPSTTNQLNQTTPPREPAPLIPQPSLLNVSPSAAPSATTAQPDAKIINQLETCIKHSVSKENIGGEGGIKPAGLVRSASTVGVGMGGVAEATEAVNALASGLERVLGAVDVLKPVGAAKH